MTINNIYVSCWYKSYTIQIGRINGHLLQFMGNEWEDCKLSIFEDMTRESAVMRKQFTAAWKLPWDLQGRNTVAHL